MVEPDTCPTDVKSPAAFRSRAWLWFVGGFLLVFIGIFFLSRFYYDGHSLSQTRVWHYYLLEIQRAWNSTGHLGPASGSSTIAAVFAFWHF
jgi:hypothetical protein